MLNPIIGASLVDELLKFSATRKNMTVAQSRQGRRPMSVSTMLRKEKDGTMYKQTKVGSNIMEVAMDHFQKRANSEGPEQSSLFYHEGDSRTGGRALPKAKPGDVPSREGDTRPRAENRQDNVASILKGSFPATGAETEANTKVAGGELEQKPGDVPSDESAVKAVKIVGQDPARETVKVLGSSGGGQGTAPPPQEEFVNAGRFYGPQVDPRNVSHAVHQDSVYAPSTPNPLDKVASVSRRMWLPYLDPSVREALT